MDEANGQNGTLGGLTASLNDQSLAVEAYRRTWEGGLKGWNALGRREAGRSQGVETAGTAKGCSHPPEVHAATGR